MDAAVGLAALPTRNGFLVLRLPLIPSPNMPYLNIPQFTPNAVLSRCFIYICQQTIVAHMLKATQFKLWH